jgi:hypothetical protein
MSVAPSDFPCDADRSTASACEASEREQNDHKAPLRTKCGSSAGNAIKQPK